MTLIDPCRLFPLLGAAAGRFDVVALAECDSTNSALLRQREAPAGMVVVADRQTAGRGRRGRQWLSTPEDALTFSLLWRFAGPPGDLAGLSLAVGAALAQGLECQGARGIGLKWPNDLLLLKDGGFAKLGGILVELAGDRRGSQAVIGIGLNLRRPAGLPGVPAFSAAGLDEAMPRLPERHALLACLLVELAGVLDRFSEQGFGALRAAWQARHAWQDKAVRLVEEGRPEAEGICRGCDRDGALLLETGQGIKRVLAGDVSLRAAA